MVPPIQPPTDNLYKFKAIIGSLLVGFSLVTPVYLTNAEFVADTEIRGQIEAAQNKANEAADLALKFTKKFVNPATEPVATTDGMPVPDDELRHEAMDSFHDAVKNVDIAFDAMGKHKAVIERLENIFRDEWWYVLIGLVGTFIAGSGFRGWRQHVQEPLDQLLQYQLEKARLDAKVEKQSDIALSNTLP